MTICHMDDPDGGEEKERIIGKSRKKRSVLPQNYRDYVTVKGPRAKRVSSSI